MLVDAAPSSSTSHSQPRMASAGRCAPHRRRRRHVHRDRGRTARQCRAGIQCTAARRVARVGQAVRTRRGAKVVDLSSDLRPGNNGQLDGAACVTIWTHRAESGQAVAGADVVANPGCYPTAILLALAPLVRNGLLESGSTIRRRGGERRDRRRIHASSGSAVRGNQRGLSRIRSRKRSSAPARDECGARAGRIRQRPRLHAAPSSGRARNSCDDRRPAERRDRQSAFDLDGRVCAASRSFEISESTPALRDVVRTNSREDLSRESSEYGCADADHHVGNRQSHQGRRGPGASECEPHARLERDSWDCAA